MVAGIATATGPNLVQHTSFDLENIHRPGIPWPMYVYFLSSLMPIDSSLLHLLTFIMTLLYNEYIAAALQ